MKRKIAFVTSVLICAFIMSVSAQKAVITFTDKTHDFGQIHEDGGNASHSFEFTNTGNTPLVIQRVNASCGCTTPEWTRTPIEPGKKGRITATYNPVGRPGAFSKDVYVYSNASNEMERLVISGNVTPRASGSAATGSTNNFPVTIGNLGLNSKIVQFGNVQKGSTQTRAIAVKNTSGSPLNVSLDNVPAYITANASPATLQPNQEGVINFSFDSNKTTEWGPLNESVYVVLNNNKQPNDSYKINVIGNIFEDFAKMSAAEKRQAPIMEIKSPNLHFGKIKKGNKVRGKFAVKNAGSNSLEIRRVINNNSDITIRPVRASIRGGRTENLHLDIDTKFLPKGNYKKTFSVVTNDPAKANVIYTVDFSVI